MHFRSTISVVKNFVKSQQNKEQYIYKKGCVVLFMFTKPFCFGVMHKLRWQEFEVFYPFSSLLYFISMYYLETIKLIKMDIWVSPIDIWMSFMYDPLVCFCNIIQPCCTMIVQIHGSNLLASTFKMIHFSRGLRYVKGTIAINYIFYLNLAKNICL